MPIIGFALGVSWTEIVFHYHPFWAVAVLGYAILFALACALDALRRLERRQ